MKICVGGLLGACEACRPRWDLWGHTQEGSGAVHGVGEVSSPQGRGQGLPGDVILTLLMHPE